LLSTSQLWGEQMSLTPNEIIERSRRLIEDADVIRAGLNARKTSADGIRAYVHQTADAAIARADLAKVRALDAANTAPNNRAGAEQRYEEAREIVENARMLSDREEGHSVAEKKDEWKECRITIDRFDKLLVDLRKTGTGFITALIGASALFLPKTPSAEVAATSMPAMPDNVWIKFSVFATIVVLIVGVYIVDRIHQVFLESSVKRASELEQLIGYKITQDLTASVGVWQAFVVGVFLYILMIVAVGAIFAVTDVHNILPLFRWPPTFSQCVTLTSAAAVTFVALRAIWTSTMHWGWRLVIAVLFATAWVTAYYHL
jgi:hypothetical protein